jgi:hypothetical protein
MGLATAVNAGNTLILSARKFARQCVATVFSRPIAVLHRLLMQDARKLYSGCSYLAPRMAGTDPKPPLGSDLLSDR